MAKLQATALAAILMAFSVEAGVAQESAETVEPVPTHSFSGAYLAGRAAEFDNDLESAITYYKRAIALDPDNVELQQTLLLTLISSGRVEEALPFAQKLKTVPEAERFSRMVLAVDAFEKEDFPAAERWLDIVIESDLDRLVTGVMTSWALAGQDDHDAALANVDSLEGPEWYEFFLDYHRALLMADAGRQEEAIDAFESLVEEVAPRPLTTDTFDRVTTAFAALLSSNGDTEAALDVIEKVQEAGRNSMTIADVQRRLEEGEAFAPLIEDSSDGAAEILLNIATELASSGGDAFVRLYLQYALALRPDSDAALVQLAHVAERQQQGEQAIALYSRIDEDSPWARLADFQIGLNLADLERPDEAVAYLKDVLEKDPTDMRGYLALGGVYFSQKNFQAGAELYDRAVSLIEEPEDKHWNIFYQRGIAYERLKEWEKAEPNFRRALELYPDHPQVLNYLGYSWVDMNMNLEEGLELIRRAAELRPSDGYIIDSLGWAYYRLGNYDEAVEHLERAVSLRPGDPILNDHLGDVYWRVGRRLEARFQWSHVLDLEPEPELQAEVEKKLEDGLPPEEEKKFADAAGAPRNVISDGVPAPAGPTDAEAQAGGEREEPAAAPQPVAEPETYTVKPGQTLWSIAVEELGDGDRFREILEINPTLRNDPDRIRPGQELRLPR